MRLLYFTRSCTIHDRRFLLAFAGLALETGVVFLRETGGGTQVDQQLPLAIKILGELRVPAHAGMERLDLSVDGFRSVCRAFKPDVILAGPLTDCGYIAARAAIAAPLVLQSWAFDVFWESKIDPDSNERVRHALSLCTALFADCAAVVARCEGVLGRSLPRHFIMPWGIDLSGMPLNADRSRMRQELGLHGRKILLHTRGLEPVYQIETLLSGFWGVYRQHPEAVLLLASVGSLRPQVDRFVSDHSLESSVRVLGAVSHDVVWSLFSASDLYVSCAASDGTSLSLLESMACGVPPIVTDVGGNTEWVTHQHNGWVVPVGDSEELIKAVGEALTQTADDQKRLIEHNRSLVEEKANWTQNIRVFLDFLNSLVGTSPIAPNEFLPKTRRGTD